MEKIRIALSKKLGPEFISKRKGPGYNNVQYLEGWKAINLANEIFGPNGWSTELKDFKVDYIDDKHGSISLGLSCVVRVILKDGTFHEDVGYGSIDNCKSKSMAFDKCKKEAFTDGMKRALRQFGNALGNCLYDKEFLQQITKVTSEPNKFDATDLLRRSSTMPKPVEHTEEAEIQAVHANTLSTATYVKPPQNNNNNDSNIKNSVTKSNKNIIPSAITKTNSTELEDKIPPQSLSERSHTGKNKDEAEDSFIFSDDWPDDEENEEQILNSNNFDKNGENLPESEFEEDENENENENLNVNVNEDKNAIQDEITLNKIANSTMIPEHVTFVSATSADTIQLDPTLQNSLKFDISYTSSQMNKSSFINHNKSLPIKKSMIKNIDENKENKSKKTNTSNVDSSADTSTGSTNFANVKSNIVKTNVNGNLNINPIVKRSFGLPPNKLPNKRLKK
ncbi:DNA repair protein rad52 [Pichia californica]|nr:DNA repair protein rad52 [[Candida] californica]